MGTRSNICRLNTDGSYTVIYCHWDGYPSGVGRTLYENYKTPVQVEALLALGDLSGLREEPGVKHPFEAPSRWLPAGGKIGFMEKINPRWTQYQAKYGRMCLAYGRDRGAADAMAKRYADYDHLSKMLEDAWTEWVYVYSVAEQKWFYTNNPSPTWFKCCGEQRQTEALTPAAWAEEDKEQANY